MANKHEVLSLHYDNPTLSAKEIAQELSCLREYVVATAKRNNLVLPLKNAIRNDPKILRADARKLLHRAEKLIARAVALEGLPPK